MRFPRELCTILMNIFIKINKLKMTITPEERISRFIFSSRHFNKHGRVMSGAFSPPPDLRMSVYRTAKCSEKKIWYLAKTYVEKNRLVKARADLGAQNYLKLDLTVEPIPCPHNRHAEVVGWPSEKSMQKMISTELANQAECFIRP